jgi:mannose-6-phosphate isomerase
VQERFGSHLPFLFKILAVGRPLSIQAHPNQKQARQGYARENKLKISLEARQRNYQDDHHKPEIICSLGSFWALIGFRPWREIIDLLKKNGLKKLAKEFRPGDLSSEPQALRSFFTHLIHLGKEQQRALVHEAVAKAASLKDPDRAAQWVVKLGRLFPDDIMALAPLFLNLVHLKAGEAAYVAPGELHAYLKGNAIELMANSDNSLRGGLTPKHVDSSELLKIVSFAGRPIPVLRPKARQEGERIYQTPAEEFQLSVIHLQSQRPFAGYTENRVTIMICTRGLARIRSSANRTAIPLSRGTAVVIPAGVGKYWIQGRAHIYKATVPRTDE